MWEPDFSIRLREPPTLSSSSSSSEPSPPSPQPSQPSQPSQPPPPQPVAPPEPAVRQESPPPLPERNWLEEDPDEPQRKYLRSLINGGINGGIKEEEDLGDLGDIDGDAPMPQATKPAVKLDPDAAFPLPPLPLPLPPPPSMPSNEGEDAWHAADAENAWMRSLINGETSTATQPPMRQPKQPPQPPQPQQPHKPYQPPETYESRPAVEPLPFDPRNPWKNAGLMRDIGGVDGFMKVMRGTHRFPEDKN